MIQQIEISLSPKSRGFHLVTSEIAAPLAYAASPINGDAQICKHTSCGLSINENADPDVRVDMETIFNRLVPENNGGARDLVVTHLRKIDMADEIFVIRSNLFACQSKNVGGYIGESTKREIAYAEQKGKKVNYLES